MDIVIVQNLLTKVSELITKEKEESKRTGNRFNVFEILELSSNETRTHSAFLASLLNPKGLHGMDGEFLNLFLKEINYTGFHIETANVEIEKNIGYVSKGYEDGGRIDLLITDSKGNAIIIENKIYAPDQFKQLYRYYLYGKNKHKQNLRLLYLNLYGTPPSPESTNGNEYKLDSNKDYHIISYKKNIVNWLRECLNSSINKPIVKETIEQYITLIKNLTGQSKHKSMESEIAKLISSTPENIEAAFTIQRNGFDIEIRKILIKQLANQLEEKTNEIKIFQDYYADPEWGFKVDEDGSYIKFFILNPKYYGTYISFGFESGMFTEFSVGVSSDEFYQKNSTEFAIVRSEVTKRLSFISQGKDYPNWFFLHYYTQNNSETSYAGLKNWTDRKQIWFDIPNGKTATFLFNIAADIREKLKDVLW